MREPIACFQAGSLTARRQDDRGLQRAAAGHAQTLSGYGGVTQVVCQRTPVIGSNIPGPPVCASKREWRERAEHIAAFVDDFEQRNAALGIRR